MRGLNRWKWNLEGCGGGVRRVVEEERAINKGFLVNLAR